MNNADAAITDAELANLFSGPIPYDECPGFYIDESIDVLICEMLGAEGVRATNVFEQQQVGEPSDLRLLANARATGSIFITAESRFKALHQHSMSHEGLTHPGIVLVRTAQVRQPRGRLAALLIRLADRFDGFPDGLENELYSL